MDKMFGWSLKRSVIKIGGQDIFRSRASGGQALAGQAVFPLVLGLSLFLGIISATVLGSAYLQSVLSGQNAFAQQALAAVQSGTNDALMRVARDKTWISASGYNLVSGSATATITVTDTGGVGAVKQRTVTVSSTVRGVLRKLQTVVNVSSSGQLFIVSQTELTS